MTAKAFKFEMKQSTVSPDVMIIKFEGELDAASNEKISKCFDTILGDKKKFIIADMSKVTGIASTSLGELMGGRKRMIEINGDLVLAGMDLEVRTRLNLIGANKIFRFFNDIRSALNAYKWEFEKKAETIHVTFPPSLKLVPPVRQLVSRITKQKGYGNRDSFRIETIVDEVCNNAVEHGVKDTDQDIDIDIKIDRSKIELNVVNKSDPEKVASLKNMLKPKAEHVSKPDDKRGRGMTLIKMLSNALSVDFSEKGTSVHIIKVREE